MLSRNQVVLAQPRASSEWPRLAIGILATRTIWRSAKSIRFLAHIWCIRSSEQGASQTIATWLIRFGHVAMGTMETRHVTETFNLPRNWKGMAVRY